MRIILLIFTFILSVQGITQTHPETIFRNLNKDDFRRFLRQAQTKEEIQARIDASKAKAEATKEEVQVRFEQMKKEKLEKQIDKKEQRLEKLYTELNSIIV